MADRGLGCDARRLDTRREMTSFNCVRHLKSRERDGDSTRIDSGRSGILVGRTYL